MLLRGESDRTLSKLYSRKGSVEHRRMVEEWCLGKSETASQESSHSCVWMITAVGPHEGRGRKSMEEAFGSMISDDGVRKMRLELKRKGPKAGESKNTYFVYANFKFQTAECTFY